MWLQGVKSEEDVYSVSWIVNNALYICRDKKLLGAGDNFFLNFPWNLKIDCQDIERGDRNYTPE